MTFFQASLNHLLRGTDDVIFVLVDQGSGNAHAFLICQNAYVPMSIDNDLDLNDRGEERKDGELQEEMKENSIFVEDAAAVLKSIKAKYGLGEEFTPESLLRRAVFLN